MEPAKHEEVAIYAVNLRIPNVCRIAGIAIAMEQSAGINYEENERILNDFIDFGSALRHGEIDVDSFVFDLLKDIDNR